MFYSSKRQAFLVDQGYAFKVITHLQGIESLKGLAFTSVQERRELLQDVMLQNEMAGDIEKISDDMFSRQTDRGYAGSGPGGNKKLGAKRMAGALSELSGGQDMAYIEVNKSRNKDLKGGKGPHNKFIAKLKRDNEKRRSAE